MGLIIRLFALLLLTVFLGACGEQGTSVTPQLVTRAITYKLEATQQQLAQELDFQSDSAPRVRVRHVQISNQTPLQVLGLPTYRVRGTYEATLTETKGDILQSEAPFDIYLQRQREGKTWRLVYLGPNLSQVRLSPPIFY